MLRAEKSRWMIALQMCVYCRLCVWCAGTSNPICKRGDTSNPISTRHHTSPYVTISQHTSWCCCSARGYVQERGDTISYIIRYKFDGLNDIHASAYLYSENNQYWWFWQSVNVLRCKSNQIGITKHPIVLQYMLVAVDERVFVLSVLFDREKKRSLGGDLWDLYIYIHTYIHIYIYIYIYIIF